MTPSLKRLLISQVPADFADWLDYVAIGALLAFVWQADMIAFAFWVVGMGLPYLLIGPFAGALVDRSDIRKVLIFSNIGRAAATFLLILAPNWQVLVAVVALRSTIDTFYSPAKQAAIQALTRPDQLLRINGLSFGINQSSKIMSPALGGALLIIFEPQAVFLVNTVISLLAAAILLGMPTIPVTRNLESDTSIWRDVKNGLAYAANTPPLRQIILLMTLAYFAIFIYDTLIPPLTRDLGFSETMLGLSMAAIGAGGVLGAVWFSVIKTKLRPLVYISIGSLVSAILIILLGLSEIYSIAISQILFLSLFVVVGFAMSMSVIPTRTIIQQETSPEMIARVTALNEAIHIAAILIASFTGAFLARQFSTGVAFVTGGCIMLIASAIAAHRSRQ